MITLFTMSSLEGGAGLHKGLEDDDENKENKLDFKYFTSIYKLDTLVEKFHLPIPNHIKIDVDGNLKLIYVGDLVDEIIKLIRNNDNSHEQIIPYTAEVKVSEILALLQYYRISYQDKGEIPVLHNDFEHKLFNTYRCYMDVANYFPKKFVQHADNRGAFVEIARLGISGQTSFSTTLPGITRGNHFHTRKIERFSVIKGKALIQLRKIGSNDVHNYYLSGEEPAYVDMPIWYTHNIKNIGEEELYTMFWINEFYDANDHDTYFEKV